MSRARVQTLRQRLSLILTVTCRTAPVMKSCREHQWRFLDHRPQTHSWNPQTCLYIATRYFSKISKWPFAQQSHSKIFHLNKKIRYLAFFFFPLQNYLASWSPPSHLITKAELRRRYLMVNGACTLQPNHSPHCPLMPAVHCPLTARLSHLLESTQGTVY